MAERKRTRALTVRVLDAELGQLAQLADHEGITASEWIRNTIRRDHLLTFGAAKPAARQKRNPRK